MKSVSLKTRKKVLSSALVSTLFATGGAVSAYEFNTRLLEEMGGGYVDLSVFSGEINRLSGDYLADFKINQGEQPIIKDYPITFFVQDEASQICFTPALIARLPIKKTAFQKITHTTDDSEGKDCSILNPSDALIKIDFNTEDQMVDLTIPQAYITPFDPLWVPPQEREYGVNGAFLDYSLLWMTDRNKKRPGFDGGGSKNSSRWLSNGVVGVNIHRFRFRGEYQYNSDVSSGKKLNWSQYYGYTDIGAWNAKLYGGQLVSRSNIFDNVRLKGVSLFSDENMMPSYLRGYAPEITGTVSSNAVVTLRYQGTVLNTTQVPAGPFAIGNLPSYVSGKVNVEIREENGVVREYEVDVARVPYLTRKGSFRYSANIGRVDPLNRSQDIKTNVISLDGSYGLTDNVSLFGGVFTTTNREYKAFNLGLGLNLQSWGAISFDVTRSSSNVNSNFYQDNFHQEKYTGMSYRINYAKRFSSNTNLNIAAYRFSSRDYTSFFNYLDMKSYTSRNSTISGREKNRLSVSLSHYFEDIDLSITGSISRDRYWNQAGSTSYNLSVNRPIKSGWLKGSSVSLSVSKEKNQARNDNERISLFVNIPIKDTRNYVQYSNTVSNNDKSMSQQLAFIGNTEKMNYRIGATTYGRRDLSGSIDHSVDGWFDMNTGYGHFTASGNYQDDRKSLTFGFDGSITATQYGIATHDKGNANSSRLIVDTEVAGVDVEYTDSTSNIFGLAGVGNVGSYYHESYSIDGRQLPDNVEIKNAVMDFATTEGAIIYRSVNAVSGARAIVTIKLDDGTYPPFGAGVYRKNGQDTEVAIVAENGLTYLTGLNDKSEFTVEWSGHSCKLRLASVEEVQELTCYMN